MDFKKPAKIVGVKVAGDVRAIGDVDITQVTIHGDRDELELAAMGKKQVLKRNFGFWSIMGLSLSCTITWEGLLTVFTYGLTNGGPAGLVYGFIFCWAGYAATMASMAELASMIPTAGGQYHWVYQLAPTPLKSVFSYITGWQTVIAWQAAFASTCYLGGAITQGLIIMNYPEYEAHATRWQGTLLMYAVLLFATFFNTVLAKHLPKVEWSILVIHLGGFLCILVPLVYFAPHGTAEDVFGRFLSDGGYDSDGLAFLVGIISSTFAFLGADGPVHMSEETENASTVVPWCMLGAIGVNGTLGFGFLIAMLFCIGNIGNAETGIGGFAFLEIFKQAVSSVSGATAMGSFLVVINIFASISVFAAASRLTWAFARDKGLPGSRWLGKVEPRTQLPLYSCGLTILISLLLALINIGSTAAFNAFVSLVVSGFLGSYLLPIGLLIWLRLRHPKRLSWGAWHLGRFGLSVNVFALCWAIIAMVFSFFPTFVPVTNAANMNWSCLLYGAMFLFAVAFWFAYGRTRYDGPVIETTLADQIA